MFRLIIGALLLTASAAYGQLAETARNIAMGGAVRGDPVGNSALIANVAGMARSQMYAAQGQYTRSAGGFNAVGANVVDSKTKPNFAVGAAYNFQWSSDDAIINSGHDARLGFAHPFRPKVFHAGLGLRYLHINREVAEVGTEIRDFTMDAGLLFSPTPAVHIGLVGHNLLETKDPSVTRQAGGGIAFTGEFVTLDADLIYDFDAHPDGAKPIAAVGGEMLVSGMIPLRAGYRYDGITENNWVSGGVGFMDRSSARGEGNQINLAFRQNLDVSEEWLFAASLVFFL